MNRSEKEVFVKELGLGVEGAQALALMSFNKLTVEQMTLFRLGLRKNNIRVKVVKNTLAKRVFDATPFKEVGTHLEGPTLVAFGTGDPVVTAKALTEWIGKENFDVKIKTAIALGKVMSETQIKALAKLPGRNDLFVSFLWALKSSPTKFLYGLQDAPRRLGYALGALKQKKEKEAT